MISHPIPLNQGKVFFSPGISKLMSVQLAYLTLQRSQEQKAAEEEFIKSSYEVYAATKSSLP